MICTWLCPGSLSKHVEGSSPLRLSMRLLLSLLLRGTNTAAAAERYQLSMILSVWQLRDQQQWQTLTWQYISEVGVGDELRQSVAASTQNGRWKVLTTVTDTDMSYTERQVKGTDNSDRHWHVIHREAGERYWQQWQTLTCHTQNGRWKVLTTVTDTDMSYTEWQVKGTDNSDRHWHVIHRETGERYWQQWQTLTCHTQRDRWKALTTVTDTDMSYTERQVKGTDNSDRHWHVIHRMAGERCWQQWQTRTCHTQNGRWKVLTTVTDTDMSYTEWQVKGTDNSDRHWSDRRLMRWGWVMSCFSLSLPTRQVIGKRYWQQWQTLTWQKIDEVGMGDELLQSITARTAGERYWQQWQTLTWQKIDEVGVGDELLNSLLLSTQQVKGSDNSDRHWPDSRSVRFGWVMSCFSLSLPAHRMASSSNITPPASTPSSRNCPNWQHIGTVYCKHITHPKSCLDTSVLRTHTVPYTKTYTDKLTYM